MKLNIYIKLFILGIFLIPKINFAQVDFNKKPDDDLGQVEDNFQEHFFEALKQKGIENYDRAVNELLKCLELDDSNSVVYFELGKNYVKLKNFGAAEDALKKAVNKEPDNEWYLDELYEVYAQQNDYDKAIKTVRQLVKYHPDYKEDLAALYVKTQKYKNALEVLDELDAEFGVTYNRDILRNQIYDATGKKKDQIENLEERVENNPDQETNYLALIYRYSENNQKEEAFETAKKLLEISPDSHLAHLALYKFYLDENNPDKAIESMKIVVQSSQIKPNAKALVLSDFVKYVKLNPQYEPDLIEATIVAGGEDNNVNSYLKVAEYYHAKEDKINALKYYKEALKSHTEDYTILKNILLLEIDLEQYEVAKSESLNAINSYPSQPLLYLINGVASNKLNKPKDAIEMLEMGLDYIIDDTKMELDFYKQLSIAYMQTNNTQKAKTFSDKAKQLEIHN
ncbi:tetratricopeptide repeat protein [Yeosuana sp. MJ-SS3]|uniref:Tetratricopeptide repeat protein n=1 Tax=Gilvirhabdus luticola TaxID=3079858 RepID=A0ABU3U2K0_9FLAO|nr:tetratricopeptide repeat protein [Yeosuana sp. MJ-SS3]MDU8884613.1 tetratricopeptide repeat protein [Yeosuana sp. MJ-SS3]